MAKPSKNRKMVALARDDVANIRRRYAMALRQGKTVKEAARIAQSGESIEETTAPSPSPSASGEPTQTVRLGGGVSVTELASTQTKSLSGKETKDEPPVRPDIPPNWQDLPWPDLKKLADALAGHDCKSRKQCAEVITGALKDGLGS